MTLEEAKKLKVGDKVKLIDTTNIYHDFKVGGAYIINDIRLDLPEPIILLGSQDGDTYRRQWARIRQIEAIEEPPTSKSCRHPGEVIWEDVFNKDIKLLLNTISKCEEAHQYQILKLIKGDRDVRPNMAKVLSLLNNGYTEEYFLNLQKEYDKCLKPQKDEKGAIYEMIAAKLSDLTGLHITTSRRFVEDAETLFLTEPVEYVLLEKILGAPLPEWIKQRFLDF